MNIIFKLLNSLFLKVQKNRTLAFLIAASLSWLVSVYAFSFDGFQKWDIVEGLVLFFADMPDGDNGWIITGKLLWMITLAAAIVFVALKDFLYQLTIKSIANSLEKHIVVCGNNNLDISKRFGVDVDSQISEDQVEEMQQFNSLLSNTINLKQHAIVISDSGMTDEALSQYSSQGIYFVNADNSPETWNKAGIETCDFVIVSDESDSKNIAVANRINEYLKKENKVKIYTNVEDYITMSVASNKDNISFFNNSLTATRKLFQSKCLTTGVNTFDKNKEQVHLLVIGFGNYGQSVALEAIKLGHFYNGNSLKITIVDQSKTAFDAFKKYYNYESIAALELEFVLMNVESKDFDQRILDNFDATYVAICLSDDNTTQLILQDMAAKLHQNESLDGKHIPFAVRIKEDDDLRCNYESIDILKFEQTTIKDIKGVDLNDKAQDLHEMYGGIWEGLSFHEKDKNYAPADHEIIKTAVIKNLIHEHGQEEVEKAVSLQKQKDKHYKFNELSDMQQKMIDMEHRRWNAYHYINGWKSKDIYDKDAEHKLHPCLINTSKLENLPKAKDFKIDYYFEDIKSWKITFDRLISTNTK
jgi:voltage-gated potassium channel Kch